MSVLKFGGTSVATSESIQQVVKILCDKAEHEPIVAVVSALGGVTDTLLLAGEQAFRKEEAYFETYNALVKRHLNTATALSLSNDVLDQIQEELLQLKDILQGVFLINEFSKKTQDKVVSFGELLSSVIVSEAVKKEGCSAVRADSRDLLITDSQFTNARLLEEPTRQNIQQFFAENNASITVMPGFVSRNQKGEATTLGRGGSDYTAAIVAEALDAKALEIWTDVSGMYTANPKWVKQAYPLTEISYHEAMELSHFGAKVLFPPTIRPVLNKNITIRIKNTFEPDAPGTEIIRKVKSDKRPVKGISHLSNIALLTLEGTGIVGVPGFSKRLFEALASEAINVILITQASSEHSICVAVLDDHVAMAASVTNRAFAYEISLGTIDPVIVEQDLAIIALIGDRMKSHQGISGKMFSSLGKNNVNIRAIAQGASERNISAVIAAKDVKKALNTLHYRFFERQVRTVNLFIVGVGNVGKRLLAQIKQQQEALHEALYLKIRVAGISNSRTMLLDEEGIDLTAWEEMLATGEKADADAWFEAIQKMNLRNSIFMDITASASVAKTYNTYLQESISVIACNKIACSSEYKSYQKLKTTARKYYAQFLFETNVGAGLPVINTLKDLIHSGDRVTAIQAVLSGSLNFVFNNYNGNNTFHDIVQQAQEEGYTEPDPRIDLSGVDVARKILILARESGYVLELEDIENKSFLPKPSLAADTVADFYETLQQEEAHFKKLYNDASEAGNRLKYVATFENGKAQVGLQQIAPDHPFYHLDGKDNIVLFYTQRYAEQPLIIKGAGAGADVTASGLFGDIIRLANN